MALLSSAALLVDDIARSGSIRRAAERLNLSPSAVNRRLLNLESDLGTPLFERFARGVRLTAAGELILADIRRWRREQERVQSQIRELKGLERGHVAFGSMECFTANLLPRATAALRKRHPRVTIEFFIAGAERIMERLEAQTLDVALCFNAPLRAAATTHWRMSVQTGLVLSPTHPLTRLDEIRLADCAPFPFVLPDRSLGLREIIDLALKRIGLELEGWIATNSIAQMKALVTATDCLALLSEADVRDEIERGHLKFMPLNDLRPAHEDLRLISLKTRVLSPHASLFADLIRTELMSWAPAPQSSPDA